MASEDAFDYIDSNLSSNSFNVFREMKETGELCDITIRIGVTSLEAHRIILAAGIPYFRDMFGGNFSESVKTEISVEDIDPTTLQYLIDFAYCGKLHITAANVENLLRASVYLQLNNAVDACFTFLLRIMAPDTLMEVLTYAESINHVKAIESIHLYIRENFEDIASSEAILNFPFPMLKELISRDDLFVMSEKTVFEAVMNWVKANDTERFSYLPELIQFVRIPLLTPEYINTHVSAEELIKTSSVCTDVVANPVVAPDSSAQERYCKEKHHLKCFDSTGRSMYCICPSASESTIKYYDPFQKKWPSLFCFQELHLCKEYASYVACLGGMLLFIRNGFMATLCLKNLKFTSIECGLSIPLFAGVTFFHHKIYFFGGIGESSKLIHCLLLDGATCLEVGRMTMQRASPGVASLEDEIYVTGGCYVDGNEDHERESDDEHEDFDYGSDVEIDDDSNSEYSFCSSCDDTSDGEAKNVDADCEAGPSHENEGFYGSNDDETPRQNTTSFKTFKSVERYNPRTGRSILISPMLQARYGHGCATLARKVYVCGGYIGGGEPLFTVEVYDPATLEWSFIKPLNIPVGDVTSSVSYSGKIYAFHDVSPEDATCAVEIYDPATNAWESEEYVFCSDSHVRVVPVVTYTVSRINVHIE